jgi:hypothetical protein
MSVAHHYVRRSWCPPRVGTSGGGSCAASSTLLELNDEPRDGLAYLLEADDADGLDVGGSGRRGGEPGRLIDEALKDDVLTEGLDELLGMVSDDAKELPPLLEGLERRVSCLTSSSAARLCAGFHHHRRRCHECMSCLARPPSRPFALPPKLDLKHTQGDCPKF